jgi:hypothetical protein
MPSFVKAFAPSTLARVFLKVSSFGRVVHSKIGNLVLRARSEIIDSALRNKKALNPKHEIRNNTECPKSK